MPCKEHDKDDCPECERDEKSEKKAAALNRLRHAILKSAAGIKSPSIKKPSVPSSKIPGVGSETSSGPGMSINIGGNSIGAGVENPIASR